MGGAQSTVTGLLAQRLEADPDSEYLDVCGVSVTAASVADTAGRLSSALAALGVAPGDRVATLLENSIEAALAWWGIVSSGAVAVPVNTAYKGEYLRHQLADSGSRVLVVAAEFADRAAAVVPSVPELTHVVIVGSADSVDSAGLPAVGGATTHAWSDLLSASPAPPVPVRPSDLATFVYTGGTTGPSKGCMLSHNYHEALARQIGICWERTADDVVWTPAAPVPLQRHRHGRAGAAGLRRPCGDLPPVLGVELLAGDEPHRRHHHVDAGHDGLPPGPRRRPPGDAVVRLSVGEHVAAPDRRRARCRSRSTTCCAPASGSRRSAAPTG